MTHTPGTLAVFPGMFDPITLGHVDVVARGAALFDRVVVAVGDNPGKTSLFTLDQRVAMVNSVFAGTSNVEVQSYSGLTIDFANSLGATVILRGLRSVGDLHAELQMAETNRLAGNIETLFIATAAKVSLISSTLVRQIAQSGGDVSAMVPPAVLEYLASSR
jgi:pantetheine-phosphate adenylyltransferase